MQMQMHTHTSGFAADDDSTGLGASPTVKARTQVGAFLFIAQKCDAMNFVMVGIGAGVVKLPHVHAQAYGGKIHTDDTYTHPGTRFEHGAPNGMMMSLRQEQARGKGSSGECESRVESRLRSCLSWKRVGCGCRDVECRCE